ncbi:MAG: helix-turn-helix transcriptional regulator, partial [Candidatus Kapaibacterium sp.]
GGGEFRKIHLLFQPHMVPFTTDRDRFGFLEERKTEAGIEMDFNFPDLNHFSHWLMQFGNGVEVLEPEELKERVKTLAGGILQMYGEERE